MLQCLTLVVGMFSQYQTVSTRALVLFDREVYIMYGQSNHYEGVRMEYPHDLSEIEQDYCAALSRLEEVEDDYVAAGGQLWMLTVFH